MITLFAAKGGGDLFQVGQNLATKLGHLGGFFLALVVGVVALGLVATHRHAAALILVLAAIVPAWFLLDPTGAVNTLQSTVHALTG